jgi:hypothetical protein
MSLKDYVIGGMDRSFKLKLFRATYAMEQAGLMPGITSAFRDNYRQGIAEGKKAASDSSFHGGSRRGGYGHGMAVDMVSVRGDNRAQRWVSTVELWKWIDENERTLGVGRPYLHRDPPHVVPIDGKEFIAKRGGRPAVKVATLGGKKTKPTAVAKRTAPAAKPETKTAQAVKPATKAAQAAKPQPSTPPAAKPKTKTAEAAKPKTPPAAAKPKTKTAQTPKPQANAAPAAKPQAKPAAAVKPQPKATQAANGAPKKKRVGDGSEPKPAKWKLSSLLESILR